MTNMVDLPERQGKTIKRGLAFDIALGARIRAARIAAGMTQSALGEVVGVSYQQVQKYEVGKDRVTAGTLAVVAAAVGVHPGSFFDESVPLPALKPASRSTLADSRSARRIGERIERLGNPDTVRRLLALVDVLVEVQNGVGPKAAESGGQTPGSDDRAS